ncbi:MULTISPECIES: ABC transporter ATP-binding protein [Agathobacter]|uniref:Multidrug ABC transporter ATP-binding protein n=1 Tax=Agathobacter ruminis TaxID=1712665 RepID=A0A2G3E4V4_9FIRM|nr:MULTISPECIES: ATP-binding cassette domain-containing protein [Agathobacter]MCR5677067.1 ATP-binding cassette domain-containing protein [Agathobacter sp.]MDC7302568.1 ATP-binding cassette domain-containing protein [Agathobacter ruminis]PHU38298.1 multidrug ABC transporter ATP-binding protein [Agathobacter ruminis]
MIEINNLSLEIKGKKLLNDINMTIHDGQITGFVGPNGSGKTLIMKCICGFITSYKGEILINGKDAKTIPIKPMGIIIETPGFIPYYSGYKNLKILASLNNNCSLHGIRSSMEDVGLDPGNHLHVKKYSLGMKQRLGVAQALMEDREILILDEPFNGLDFRITEKLRNRLAAEREKEKTIILSSHNKIDIDLLCDNHYYIEDGYVK